MEKAFPHGSGYGCSMRSPGALIDTLRLGYYTAFMEKRVPGGIKVEEQPGLRIFHSAFDNRSSVVVLHGLTRRGYDDHRLTSFCTILAKLGFTAYTPNLPRLQNLDYAFSDIDKICEVVVRAVDQSNVLPGIIGFSFGGTYGLIAAAMPQIRNSLRYVLAADAYFSLNDTFTRAFSEGDTDPYARLALDWPFMDELGLAPDELHIYREIMDNYCLKENHFTIQELTIINKVLEKNRQERIKARWLENTQQFNKLSLEGTTYLQDLTAEVLLIHNQSDTLIPSQETLSIYHRLKETGKRVRCCVGDAPRHVDYIKGDLAGPFAIFYRLMCLR